MAKGEGAGLLPVI